MSFFIIILLVDANHFTSKKLFGIQTQKDEGRKHVLDFIF
jgi:hypothetical protein